MDMHICKFCGSSNTKTEWGDKTNIIARNIKKVICIDCGRVISEYNEDEIMIDPDILDFSEERESDAKWYLKFEFTASAGCVCESCELRFPREDGSYDLSENPHPALAHFHTIKIEGQSIWLNDHLMLLTRSPMSTTMKYTAYGPDRMGMEETVTVTVTEERE